MTTWNYSTLCAKADSAKNHNEIIRLVLPSQDIISFLSKSELNTGFIKKKKKKKQSSKLVTNSVQTENKSISTIVLIRLKHKSKSVLLTSFLKLLGIQSLQR